MTDIKDIILDRSIPEFIRNDYDMFMAFMQAYYTWLQQSTNTMDIAKNLRDYRDIDRTIDDFIDYFRKEYCISVPADVIGDKSLFFKHIRNFYKNKGNEASYKFLFRIIYGENLEIYYPKVDILRCSDGRWQQQVTIKVLAADITDIQEVLNNKIEGPTGHAHAEVAYQYTERGTPIIEIVLLDRRGDFTLNDTLTAGTETFEILEVVSSLSVVDGGSKYAVGDLITILDGGDEVGSGTVTGVTRGPVTGFTIIDGGDGYYRGNERQVATFAYLPETYTWESIYLPDAPVYPQDSNAFDFSTVAPYQYSITPVTLPDVGDSIVITDTPSPIGQGATGVVSLVSEDGQILAVELLTAGRDYNLPIAEVISEVGSGAVIEVLGGGGVITRTELTKFPIKTNDPLTVTVASDQGSSADLSVNYGGDIIQYPGSWTTTDSFLSSDKKLQDNYYYQDFSYVVLSGISETRWKGLLSKIIHPAGLQQFGRLKHVSTFDENVEIVNSYQTIT